MGREIPLGPVAGMSLPEQKWSVMWSEEITFPSCSRQWYVFYASTRFPDEDLANWYLKKIADVAVAMAKGLP